VLKEFRDFLVRGNVVALAIAVVIGAAFLAVVTAFTTNILTPLLGLVGIPDMSTWAFTLPNGNVVAYGLFLNALLNFILVAAAIFFFVVRPMNAMEARRKATEAAETKVCTECASEIPVGARRCPNCTQPQPLAA
jgi:large conductance mechanosensitive channel